MAKVLSKADLGEVVAVVLNDGPPAADLAMDWLYLLSYYLIPRHLDHLLGQLDLCLYSDLLSKLNYGLSFVFHPIMSPKIINLLYNKLKNLYCLFMTSFGNSYEILYCNCHIHECCLMMCIRVTKYYLQTAKRIYLL